MGIIGTPVWRVNPRWEEGVPAAADTNEPLTSSSDTDLGLEIAEMMSQYYRRTIPEWDWTKIPLVTYAYKHGFGASVWIYEPDKLLTYRELIVISINPSLSEDGGFITVIGSYNPGAQNQNAAFLMRLLETRLPPGWVWSPPKNPSGAVGMSRQKQIAAGIALLGGMMTTLSFESGGAATALTCAALTLWATALAYFWQQTMKLTAQQMKVAMALALLSYAPLLLTPGSLGTGIGLLCFLEGMGWFILTSVERVLQGDNAQPPQ